MVVKDAGDRAWEGNSALKLCEFRIPINTQFPNWLWSLATKVVLTSNYNEQANWDDYPT